jgi:hypothetical protein
VRVALASPPVLRGIGDRNGDVNEKEKTMTTLVNWIPQSKVEKFCKLNKLEIPLGVKENGGMYAGNLENYLQSEIGLPRAQLVAEQMGEHGGPVVRLAQD